jgi:IclR family acetate operon transcriptional repressor
MEARSTNYHAQALTRGIRLLREIGSASSPLSLNALHQATELPRSTLIRLLSALEGEELIVRVDIEDGRYVLGHGVLEIAAGYRQSVDAELLARPILIRVAKATHQTSNLGVLVGRSVMHVCVAEPDRAIRFRSRSGSLDETYCTGLGKMLLVQTPPDERAAHLPVEPYPAFTERTRTTRAELDAELDAIAARGLSIDEGERDLGVRCLAVPVFETLAPGELPIAVSVSGPAAELRGEHEATAVEHLRAAAAVIREDASLVHALRVTAGRHGALVQAGAQPSHPDDPLTHSGAPPK